MVEAFYILVLEEIRRQPNLKNELDLIETVLGITGKGLDVLLKILDQGDWQLKLAAAGVEILRELTPWKSPDKTGQPFYKNHSHQQITSNEGCPVLSKKNCPPPPVVLARDFGDWHAWTFKDKTAKYESLCRSALLNLSWTQLDKAEKKINAAKFIYDDWAYAHHVYGLLRGLQENQDNARFELGLALQREPSDVVKHRIERAIRLLN